MTEVTEAGQEAWTVATPTGPARLNLVGRSGRDQGLLVLGHGAGGSVDAPDLVAAGRAATDLGWCVVTVEQPYRVAGRRSPPAASRLDPAWLAAVAAARQVSAVRPVVVGGRSSGARVACRTAEEAGADGVLCLAFPWHPPGRPEKSRTDEVTGLRCPVLLVQASGDPFGTPPEAVAALPAVTVTTLSKGGHGLKGGEQQIEAATRAWLDDLRVSPLS